MAKTLIDPDLIQESCEVRGICTVHPEYRFDQGEPCLAITAPDWNGIVDFFIELASRDATLASNLADSLRHDMFGREMIFFFPSFELEPEVDDEGDQTD